MPVEITKKPNVAQLDRIIRAEMEAAVTDTGRFIRAKAAKYPPKADSTSYRRTGTLGRSIAVSPARWSGRTVSAEVGTNLHYARYVEEGTGIYGPAHRKIVPKTAKVLAWRSTGKPASVAAKLIAAGVGRRGRKIVHRKQKDVYMNFAASVKGMRPWHYMQKAFQDPESKAYLQQRVQAMFARIKAGVGIGTK